MTDTKANVSIGAESTLSTDLKSIDNESETAQGPRRSQRKGLCNIFKG
jgi:hypothetical protein